MQRVAFTFQIDEFRKLLVAVKTFGSEKQSNVKSFLSLIVKSMTNGTRATTLAVNELDWLKSAV
jgi:hypothetical protein